MNINIRGHELELFETQTDWYNFIRDYKPKYIYSGELMSIPENISHDNLGFQNLTDLMLSIKKQTYSHVEYVIIK